jgi:hypothetical protein
MSEPIAIVLIALAGVPLGIIAGAKILSWALSLYLLFRSEEGQVLNPSPGSVILTFLGSGLWFGAALVALLILSRSAEWAAALRAGLLIGAFGLGGVMLYQFRKRRTQSRGSNAA